MNRTSRYPGPPGPPGEGVVISGSVAVFGDLPTLGPTEFQFWLVESENYLYMWNGTQWVNVGSPGGSGPQGDTATIEVGAVAGAAGTLATVTNVGDANEAVFNFVITKGDKGFKGDKGDQGEASTIPGADGTDAVVSVGSTTTGAAGSSAQVTNSGTPGSAVFNFVIPRGEKGETGDDSQVPGPQGDAATVSVGTTTTGNAGTNATVTNSGTQNDAVFEFTIPKGDQGTKAIKATKVIQVLRLPLL